MLRIAGSIVVFTMVVIACGGVTSDGRPAPALVPPEITLIGVMAGEREADPDMWFTLVDGRELHLSKDTTRVLFLGGIGHPLVLGTDGGGAFVAVFAHQDGLPDDCHIVPAGGPGIERGPFIEIQGVLWRKAPTFRSSTRPPPLGIEWPGTRFCFDEQATVVSTVP